MKYKIQVYADKGTSQISVKSLLNKCKYYLTDQVKTVTAQDILQGELKHSDLFIIPGGADIPYCQQLNGQGNQHIKQFVEAGGTYIGICAGAYYACQQIDFNGKDYSVSGKRELRLFSGMAKGSLAQFTNGHYFSDSVESKAMIPLHFVSQPQLSSALFYYHGGPNFIPFNEQAVRSTQIFATYPDDTLAVISGEIGGGNYLLSGVHFELDAEIYYQHIYQMCALSEQQQEWEIYQKLKSTQSEIIWQEIMRLLTHNGRF